MSVTVKALIDSALRKLGAVGAGEQADPSEYADGLAALRLMVDAWSLESLLVPYLATEEFPLSADQAFYSMGIDGDWNTVRPEEVEVLRIRDAGGSTYPVRPSTPYLQQWQANVAVGRPTAYLANWDAFFCYIEFNAFPEGGAALITTRKPFNAAALENFQLPYDPDAQVTTVYPSGFTMTGIQTPLVFPPGYEQALVYNLAVHLRPEYPGLNLSEEVLGISQRSKALIKRRNWKPRIMVTDAALSRRRGGGFYDVRSGP